MRLDFIIPGFSKCGTTTLCAMLAEHPEIGIPNPSVPEMKEPSYFANFCDKGWSWYEGLFQDLEGKRFLGEGSTIYSTEAFAELSCTQILERFPDIRLIFIARDPIRRLESSYREMHHNGHKFGLEVPDDIGKALQDLPNMVSDTLYWQRINTFRQRIPDSRILVVFLEDFERNPAAELARCFEFIGADPTVRIERLDRRLNSGSGKLRDSRLLHYLKTQPWANFCWKHMPSRLQESLVISMKLRESFREPIRWDPGVLCRVRDQISEDSRNFLKFYGKPHDFWDCGSVEKNDHLHESVAA